MIRTEGSGMLQRHCAIRSAAISGAALIATALTLPSAYAAEDRFELVTFPTTDGGTIEAALFATEGDRAAVFAHGAVFNKESWYPQAERLQKAGVTALSIDFRGYGNSKAGNAAEKYPDVLGAVAFLEAKGFEKIAVLGGSMGGAAVLRALAHSDSKAIVKAVLLAPAGGDPISSASISKLFIVSEGDRLSATVKRLHESSAEPKQLHLYSGNAHAQHLFKTEHAEDLTKRIVKFIAQ